MAEIRGKGFSDRAWLFDRRPQDCEFPGELPTVVASDGNAVTLYANCYAHAVELDGDCIFEDNFFSMLPGETRTIRHDGANDTPIRLRVLNSPLPSLELK